MKSFALAAALAAFALPVLAEEPSATLDLSAEAPYWLMVCEPQFKAKPNLTEKVYTFTIGFLSGLQERGRIDLAATYLESVRVMAGEGIRDKEAGKFTARECETLIDSFAEDWSKSEATT